MSADSWRELPSETHIRHWCLRLHKLRLWVTHGHLPHEGWRWALRSEGGDLLTDGALACEETPPLGLERVLRQARQDAAQALADESKGLLL